MLKGKTTIELTDVNTGEKKVYEDHNMVTNFANYIFKNIGGLWKKECFYDSYNSSIYTSSYYPYRTNMLGGVMLFDNEIDPKGGETIFAPTDANMVGCGAYNFTSTNNVRGSYNPSESYYNEQEKSMKYVYDFATNQANGTIKSVCLTSIQGGFGGYENPNNVRGNNSDYRESLFRTNYYNVNLYATGRLFAMDIGKGEVYHYNIISSTEVEISTRNADFYKKKIFTSPYSTSIKHIDTYTVDISSTTYNSAFYDEKHNTIHIIGHTSNIWNAGVTLKVSKINLSTKTVENYTITNDSGQPLFLFDSTYGTWRRVAFIHDNNLYIKTSSQPYGIIRKDITGNTETKMICNWNASNPELVAISQFNDRIFFVSPYTGYAYNTVVNIYNPYSDKLSISCMNGGNLYTNSEWYRCDLYPCIDMNNVIKYCISTSSGSGFTFHFVTLNNYLATINNLETPITKTNTNTMKVIYTIKEE